MKHVNADQLREYKFDLLPEAETAETAAHLETCAECRAQLQALESQFGALDVLQDQPAVSDETIAAILKPAKQKAVIIPFWKPTLAVAASLLFVFGILRIADQPDADRTADLLSAPPQADRVAGFQAAEESLRVVGEPVPTLAALRAEQPFPPASNIELNVLPNRDEVQVTIYNEEDLTLVREKRKLVLNRGWNWLQFMWSNTLIDPTSLSLEPKTYADQVEITQLVYPPRLNDLARWTIFSETDCEAEFELTYFTSGLKWNAFYEATLSPDEQSMELRSYVRVDNGSGEDYEEAQTRLVVGKIKIDDAIADLATNTSPYGDPRVVEMPAFEDSYSVFGSAKSIGGAPAERKKITKKRLSEYQLYTIEGRETIPDGWGKRLPSFEAQKIGVINLYKFEAERWGDQTMRFLSFANTEAHQLGETPLPKGTVRVFGNVVDMIAPADSNPSSSVGMGKQRESIQREGGNNPRQSFFRNGAGSSVYGLCYIGAADIKYIPVGEEAELELGAARKVKVEPKLMRFRNENYQFDKKGNASGWDEVGDWEIEITNTKDIPVEVEIMRSSDSTFMELIDLNKEQPDYVWEILDYHEFNHWKIRTDAPYEKYDMSHFRFMVKLAPQSKKTIGYELTVHHGTRKNTAVSTDPAD